jgi:NAD(P)-dependent dehydrogenase (short-subunit alcohol dehydrogenase family)
MAELFEIDQSALKSLADKTLLITGGSSGIGLETAKLIASVSSSNKIAILDRNPPPASISIPPSRLFFYKCDITSWPEQRAGFEAAARRFGSIDAVFVNAGIAEVGDQFFTDTFDADGKLAEPDRKVLDIDMKAASDTVKLAIHWLRKNKAGGSIVMTASLAGYVGTSGQPLYSAAKHGK